MSQGFAALALSLGFVTPAQALRIAPHFSKIAHGKFRSMASRGEFEYGFAQSGLRTFLDHNWLKLLDDEWKGATITTECMGMNTSGRGDESHPDFAIADHFSAGLLGVKPTTPAFRAISKCGSRSSRSHSRRSQPSRTARYWMNED